MMIHYHEKLSRNPGNNARTILIGSSESSADLLISSPMIPDFLWDSSGGVHDLLVSEFSGEAIPLKFEWSKRLSAPYAYYQWNCSEILGFPSEFSDCDSKTSQQNMPYVYFALSKTLDTSYYFSADFIRTDSTGTIIATERLYEGLLITINAGTMKISR